MPLITAYDAKSADLRDAGTILGRFNRWALDIPYSDTGHHLILPEVFLIDPESAEGKVLGKMDQFKLWKMTAAEVKQLYMGGM